MSEMKLDHRLKYIDDGLRTLFAMINHLSQQHDVLMNEQLASIIQQQKVLMAQQNELQAVITRLAEK